MSFLDGIVANTAVRVAERRGREPLSELRARLRDAPPVLSFHDAIAKSFGVIAEHKRRSPSAGEIREGSSVTEIVRAYERGGAAALSILTEERHFGGSLDDLTEARAASDLPILRKDFTVDPYQLVEARAVGADAVLLVVGSLESDALASLYQEARALDLDALVEVHDGNELETALEIDADVIGINNRDLGDFSVDLNRTFDLLSDVPAGKTVVSESGIDSRDAVEELERIGVDAVLVGELLMRAPDPEEALRSLGSPFSEPEAPL